MHMKIACLDLYDRTVQDTLEECKPTGWELLFAKSYDKKDQEKIIKDADFILAGWSPVEKWKIDQSKKLKMIQKFGVGYEKIDIQTAKDKGIAVSIASGLNSEPVSELVILHILALYRRLLYLNETIHEGLWVKSEMRATSYQIFNKKIGIIGLGNIGKRVAKLIQSFGAEVIYYDAYRLTEKEEELLNVQYSNLHNLMSTADIITLHLPSTEETKNLIDKEKIDLMKKESILINTARGDLINEYDLFEALKNNQILGAGLDVFSEEPLPTNHPLLSLNNVVLTPHIAGTVYDNVKRMASHCFRNMELFLAGKEMSPRDVIVKGKVQEER